MEAREAFGDGQEATGLKILLGVSIAIGLGVAGAMVAANITGAGPSAAAASQVTTVSKTGSPADVRRAGPQPVEGLTLRETRPHGYF